ncbi:putative damage-inducible protein DinB [Scopulibacillus daqui]|uniref:Damage-inducible protein DinB n=1 Tax=Scopulibacillus daqui TaxID=1469162 RepID=A0ABS2PX99_9BACL|nr:DinB family protein [Scopulibacillus daqui]MBM7644588.1 putative damage-inducible protein DinB [Scopulibacillus daqui]
MNTIDLILLNLKETRRRSIIVWEAIPHDKLDWKPDEEAMTCIEMVRHVLESEYYYCLAIENRGSLQEFHSPFENRPYISVKDELSFAESYRRQFLNRVSSFSNEDLSDIKIDRSDQGYIRSLGDMLMRIAYHEAVHTGQLLDYLRTMKADRPHIWD